MLCISTAHPARRPSPPHFSPQALRRAYRIGSDAVPLRVYRLYLRNTLEERLLQLSDRLKGLEGLFKQGHARSYSPGARVFEDVLRHGAAELFQQARAEAAEAARQAQQAAAAAEAQQAAEVAATQQAEQQQRAEGGAAATGGDVEMAEAAAATEAKDTEMAEAAPPAPPKEEPQADASGAASAPAEPGQPAAEVKAEDGAGGAAAATPSAEQQPAAVPMEQQQEEGAEAAEPAGPQTRGMYSEAQLREILAADAVAVLAEHAKQAAAQQQEGAGAPDGGAPASCSLGPGLELVTVVDLARAKAEAGDDAEEGALCCVCCGQVLAKCFSDACRWRPVQAGAPLSCMLTRCCAERSASSCCSPLPRCACYPAGEDEEQEEGEGEEEDLTPVPGGEQEVSRAESAASAASFWMHLLRESWAELQVGLLWGGAAAAGARGAFGAK